jgi:hypothetical protein
MRGRPYPLRGKPYLPAVLLLILAVALVVVVVRGGL